MSNKFKLSDILAKRKNSEKEIEAFAKEKNVTYEMAYKMYYFGVFEISEDELLMRETIKGADLDEWAKIPVKGEINEHNKNTTINKHYFKFTT